MYLDSSIDVRVGYRSPLQQCLEFALAELGHAVTATGGNDVRSEPSIHGFLAAHQVDVEPIPREGMRQALQSGDVLLGIGPEQTIALSSNGIKLRRLVVDKDGAVEDRVSLRTATRAAKQSSWMVLRNAPNLDAMTSRDEVLSPWQRLAGLARIESKEVNAIVLYAAALGVLSLAAPVAIQSLVNTVAFGGVIQPLIVLTLALLIGLSVGGALQVLQSYVAEILQRRFMVRVAEDISSKLSQAKRELQDERDLTELNNRFFDVITIQKSTAELLMTGAGLALQTSLGILLLAFYHPWLMVFSLLLIVSIAVVTMLGRGGIYTATKESAAKFEIGAWLDEIARAPALFAAGPGREFCSERVAQRTGAYLRARKRHFRHVLPVLIGGVSVQAVSVVLVLAFGGYLVMERQLTLGQLVAAEVIVGAIAAGIGKFGSLAEKTFDSAAALDKLGSLFDIPAKERGFSPLLGTGPMALVASDLRLSRAGAILPTASVDLVLRPGEILWLRGASGLGTTTLLETLAGHRSVAVGEVLWDGWIQPEPDHLANQVMFLAEDHVIAGSVLDNLRLAKPGLSETEAWQALHTFGLSETVERRGGLHLKLHSRGAPLASDDRKRLLLARAWIAKPRLLLVDQVLDFSDLESRHDACKLVLGGDKPWTVIVASRYDDVGSHCDKVSTLQSASLPAKAKEPT